MMSLTNQNFISMQTKTFDFKDRQYYVLIVAKWNGYYEYPALKMNWNTVKQYHGYIYSPAEFKKLNDFERIVNLKTKNHVILSTRHMAYEDTSFLDLIQTALLKDESKYSPEYVFPVRKSKEGNIRFYLPDTFSNYNNYDFGKRYFETDIENFSKILIDN